MEEAQDRYSLSDSMKFFLRYLLPITYFQATRLNRVPLVIYNGLIEWIPAIALSLYLNSFRWQILITVAVSYLAFISLYEIGYITNDQISEKFEKDPRGRAAESVRVGPVIGLVVARIVAFALCTWALGAWSNPIWLIFHSTLMATFLFHNVLPNEMRIGTFFSLSTYRFFAPMVLTVEPQYLILLLPAILMNNSVYRLSVYLANKSLLTRPSLASKFGFYFACLPFGILLSYLYGSLIPVAVTVYFLFVWLAYLTFAKLTGIDIRD